MTSKNPAAARYVLAASMSLSVFGSDTGRRGLTGAEAGTAS